jgi:NitT/TauT family transport system ATP-binding protein
MGAPHISVRSPAHSYGSNGRATAALAAVDLQVERGEFVSVVGPSGGGKTTLLRCIGGLIEPDAGRIEVGGRTADRRNGEIGYVFQDPSLLPWRTVSGNVALPLEIGGGRADPATVAETLEAVGLSGFGGHYPHQLSGGMAQRTAFARALAMDPEVLLMDEPLGALDEITRADMSLYLLSLWERSQSTVVMVTHSVPEAVMTSDRVVIMSSRPGRIVGVVDIPLPRPRERSLEDTPEFLACSSRVRSLLLAGSTNGSSDHRPPRG